MRLSDYYRISKASAFALMFVLDLKPFSSEEVGYGGTRAILDEGMGAELNVVKNRYGETKYMLMDHGMPEGDRMLARYRHMAMHVERESYTWDDMRDCERPYQQVMCPHCLKAGQPLDVACSSNMGARPTCPHCHSKYIMDWDESF